MLTMVQSVDVSHANMMLRAFTASLLLCSAAGVNWCRISCDKGKTYRQHTMCLYPRGGDESCSGYDKGLSKDEKQLLVHLHNELRAKVARGEETGAKEGTTGPQPKATDMHRLRWDDELVTVAQRWAEQHCDVDIFHDTCRYASDGEQVGQNIDKQSGDGAGTRLDLIKSAMEHLYDEVNLMDPRWVTKIDGEALEVLHDIGHYTQMMWGETTRVGCGLTFQLKDGIDPENFPEIKRFYIKLVCNYKAGGNIPKKPVYSVGETASKCQKKSKDYPGLCEPLERIKPGLDDKPSETYLASLGVMPDSKESVFKFIQQENNRILTSRFPPRTGLPSGSPQTGAPTEAIQSSNPSKAEEFANLVDQMESNIKIAARDPNISQKFLDDLTKKINEAKAIFRKKFQAGNTAAKDGTVYQGDGATQTPQIVVSTKWTPYQNTDGPSGGTLYTTFEYEQEK